MGAFQIVANLFLLTSEDFTWHLRCARPDEECNNGTRGHSLVLVYFHAALFTRLYLTLEFAATI